MSIRLTRAMQARVREIWSEDDGCFVSEKTGNTVLGYWANLKPGWECILSGCHTCHEPRDRIANAIKWADPCDCFDCLDSLKRAMPEDLAVWEKAMGATLAECLKKQANETAARLTREVEAMHARDLAALPDGRANSAYGNTAKPWAISETPKPEPFKCPLCGQVITDGKPCGCGAR